VALESIIDALSRATGPDRRLDIEIALLVGYRRKIEHVSDGPDLEPVRRVLWIPPTKNDPEMIPHFTKSLDNAYDLAQTIAPGSVGGCSWENGSATARIDDGPYCAAATPALALCIAVLHTVKRNSAV
jgi:hypothetical protein